MSDLVPATHYVLQLTAHNAAGVRTLTCHVATLTLLGQTVAPPAGGGQVSSPAPATTTNGGGLDGSLAISAILAIIILATVLLLSIYCYKR